jgi:hypothetical protein
VSQKNKKTEVIELFSLGELYVSDFIKDGELPRGSKTEMKLILDEENGAVRLQKVAPLDTMYGKYWYRSGVNDTMKNELKGITQDIMQLMKLKENDIWIDIACNDGTLLSYLPEKLIRIGIDPADDSFVMHSKKHADLIIQDFFSSSVYKKSKFGTQKAKVITSIAMFYDLDKPDEFVKDIHEVLDEDGLWVLQLSYTPLMIRQNAFDNICHEHIYYYSLFNIKRIFEKNGFQILDCRLNDVNGGSFRIYAMKKDGDTSKFSTQPHRDVCKFRIDSLLKYEETLKLDETETWLKFYDNIQSLKKQTMEFLRQEKDKGKKIWGYGASTKGNTLLQYFGIDSTLLDGIAERNKDKWGLKTVGTNIPIESEDTMRKCNPDYLLVLPWHFISEFIQREKDFLDGGGKFIVPCPKFIVI